MYLYAFDLGMDCTGLTIFDMDTCEPVIITSFKTKKTHTHGERLRCIALQIFLLQQQYIPTIIAIERGFARFNTSTQVIYRVHGLVNYLFGDYKQIYYPPKKIKEVILNGKATKKQVQEEILKHYPNVVFNNEDESDSFAVGLTYLIQEQKMKWDKSTK